MAKIKGYAPHQMNLEQRKAHMKVNTGKRTTGYNAKLELAIEGRFTNLQIWVGNEKCMAEGGGKLLIYMRINCGGQYSVPFSEEAVNHLHKPDAMLNLLKFGFTSDYECLDEILEITKDMCIRPCISW